MPMAADTAPAAGRVWVVGVDGSSNAFDALRWAARVARGRSVSIRAATVADHDASDAMARSITAACDRIADETGLAIEIVQLTGSPTAALLDELEDAEMGVVGCRGRGGLARLLLGSVSHQLVTHAHRPTVVVPKGTEASTIDRVVVGVDGSANSKAALLWADAFAPTGAEIVAVGLWEPSEVADVDLPAEIWTLLRDATAARFEAAVDEVEDSMTVPERFRRVIETGPARLRLVELGAAADLLVLGAQGHGGWHGGVLGSVTTWAIHHLRCPTAVVPAPLSGVDA